MQLETRKKVVPLYISKEQATNKSANKTLRHPFISNYARNIGRPYDFFLTAVDSKLAMGSLQASMYMLCC